MSIARTVCIKYTDAVALLLLKIHSWVKFSRRWLGLAVLKCV